jgi:predicted deacylase
MLAWMKTSTLFALVFCAASAHAAEPSDSEVDYAPYSQIESSVAQFAARHPGLVEHVQYGKSAGGARLNLVRISDPKAHAQPGKRFAIEISGAIHGNEYLGMELDLIQRMVEDRSKLPAIDELLARGGAIYGVPVVNPDGYIARERENSEGVDLNRDFDQLPTHDRAFTQPETRELASYIDADLGKNALELVFSLDYHCCGPSLIIPWSYEDRLPEGPDYQVFSAIGGIEKGLLGFKWGNPIATVGYLANNSSLDYFYAKYGTFAFAIEGRRGGEAQAIDLHEKLIEAAVARAVAARSR